MRIIRGTPGAGHVPWKEVAQALKDIKFDGVLVIESFTSKVKSIARSGNLAALGFVSGCIGCGWCCFSA